MQYYLAIDIGASSGRHILGYIENGKIKYEEIYRFSNEIINKDGVLCWDLEYLFSEIISGLKKCEEINKIPISVGIDTWGVDFVLLDKNKKVLGDTVAYRDKRTETIDKEVYKYISEEDLYEKTGIQKQNFNTIYQLMSVKKDNLEVFNQVDKILLIPDYFHYLLSGVINTEYTNATTTGLINAKNKTWDLDILDKCGYPSNIFHEIIPPSTKIGMLKEDIQKIIGFNTNVVVPATHDTASAIMSFPTINNNSIYISSGTWSLIGIENIEPNCSNLSFENNFTNEGGYEYRYRYLKNIMGLWMIQELKKELENKYSFEELCNLASDANINSIVDCNDSRFLMPLSMINEVKNACAQSMQQVPVTVGEFAAVIYKSLAVCYFDSIKVLEAINNKKYDTIHIMGGGANVDYLNKELAKVSKKDILVGPIEATALGNIMAQMISDKKFDNLEQARECIINSFELKKY